MYVGIDLGTSGVLFAATDQCNPAPETAVYTFCHAFSGTWCQMVVVLSATDSLNWLASLVGTEVRSLTEDLTELRPPGKTRFLPYLGGERTPLNDPSIRAGFLGLEHSTDRTSVTQSVLEGVGFALCYCKEALSAASTGISSLVAVGGGSQSRYWVNVIATLLQQPNALPRASHLGAAFGAARLGLLAAEMAGPEILTETPVAETNEPDLGQIAAFEDAYARFKPAQKAIGALS